jgi:protein SMG7
MDNQLWMTTSHSFISGYKAHLALLEREKPHAPPTNGKGKPTKNIVEKRKALQRFKRFLNGEERFWKAFVLRYTDYFGMEQPKQLSSLTTLPEGEPDDGPGEHNLFPEGKAAITSERKHDREHRLAVVSKALICLGDLARYREQQKEQYVSDFPSRGRGGRPVHNLSRPNSYSKSQEFYEMARLLVPDSGNSSHQLAILANSQKDTFTAVYHYYRSLCVRSPFETAAENLQTTLNKALENYIKSLDTAEEGLAPRALAEKLKEKVVILHSTWRMSSDE